MRIDAHNHFWRYNPAEYRWIGPEMSLLQRDYLPKDLEKELSAARFDGTIAVHARQTVEETEWLLALAETHPSIKGVIGWVPLTAPNVAGLLDRFLQNEKFKGVRHVIHDEGDDEYLLRSDFNAGVKALAPRGLVYEILIFARHLPQTIRFVDQHPEQAFIVDHIAKPRLKEGLLEPWAVSMHELAKRENVACKVSGIVTEADWEHWDLAQITPYFEIVLNAFGSGRLLFGSDWPVCLVASDYRRWVWTVERLAQALSPSEKRLLFGENAALLYRLPHL